MLYYKIFYRNISPKDPQLVNTDCFAASAICNRYHECSRMWFCARLHFSFCIVACLALWQSMVRFGVWCFSLLELIDLRADSKGSQIIISKA